MISVMHTYGRYMKWNPHIHALVAERVYDKFDKHHTYNYFSYLSAMILAIAVFTSSSVMD